jgi:hypothetical protein
VPFLEGLLRSLSVALPSRLLQPTNCLVLVADGEVCEVCEVGDGEIGFCFGAFDGADAGAGGRTVNPNGGEA